MPRSSWVRGTRQPLLQFRHSAKVYPYSVGCFLLMIKVLGPYGVSVDKFIFSSTMLDWSAPGHAWRSSRQILNCSVPDARPIVNELLVLRAKFIHGPVNRHFDSFWTEPEWLQCGHPKEWLVLEQRGSEFHSRLNIYLSDSVCHRRSRFHGVLSAYVLIRWPKCLSWCSVVCTNLTPWRRPSIFFYTYLPSTVLGMKTIILPRREDIMCLCSVTREKTGMHICYLDVLGGRIPKWGGPVFLNQEVGSRREGADVISYVLSVILAACKKAN